MNLLKIINLAICAIVVYLAVLGIAATVFYYSVKIVIGMNGFPLMSLMWLTIAAIPCAYNLWLNADILRKK